MEFYQPTSSLSPYIKAYLFIENHDDIVNRVLPNTSLVMAFRYKGVVQTLKDDLNEALPSSTLSGLRKSVRLFHYLRGSGNMLVVFREAGAAAFFREPLHELFESSISLDQVWNKQQVLQVEEQLSEANNHPDRIAIIERFLLLKSGHPHQDLLVLSALQKIQMCQGAYKIKDLARSLHISQDAFEKRFRKAVGASPKQFSDIVRMKSVIRNGPQKTSLTELAFDAGYFDQPHFNKDFKLFTGQTPTDFFKSPSYW